MMSVTLLLVLSAFVCLVLSAAGKCPLWVGTLLLCLAMLLTVLPR